MKTKRAKNLPATQEKQQHIFTIREDTVSVHFREGITIKEWSQAGSSIGDMAKVSSFALGDWINYGKEHFADSYASIAADLGLTGQYLRICAATSKNFPPDKRYAALSLEHHRLLFYVKDEAAREALAKRATKEKLSAAAIRDFVAKPKKEKKPLSAKMLRKKQIEDEKMALHDCLIGLAYVKANVATCDEAEWRKVFAEFVVTHGGCEAFWTEKEKERNEPVLPGIAA